MVFSIHLKPEQVDGFIHPARHHVTSRTSCQGPLYPRVECKGKELAKEKEELDELMLSSKSETFSPTNAYASKSPLIDVLPFD